MPPRVLAALGGFTLGDPMTETLVTVNAFIIIGLLLRWMLVRL